MGRRYNNILETIGNTPVVKIGKLAPKHARTVILGGALYDPHRAVDVGLLSETADDADSMLDRACAVAASQATSPTEFAVMKGSLVAPITERLQHTRAALDRRFLDSWFADSARATRARTLAKLSNR